MVAKKSGPLKPPVIDLEANKTSNNQTQKSQQTADKAKKSSNVKSKVDPASIDKKTSFGFLSLIIGIAGGAILGVATSLLLAIFGLWPQNTAPSAPISELPNQNAAIIQELQEQINKYENSALTNEKSILILSDQQNNFDKNLATITNTASDDNQNQAKILLQINQRITALDEQIKAQTNQSDSTDLQNIKENIINIDERINALAAGATNEQSQEFALSIAKIRENNDKLLNSLTTALSNIDLHNTQIITLENNLDTIISQIAQQNEIKQAQLATNQAAKDKKTLSSKIPLALSTFESAIYNGQDFTPSLSELKMILPDLLIPDEINKIALKRLDDPKNIISEFNAVIPAILSVKPLNEDSSWQQKLLNKGSSLLAIRPTGEVEGEGPAQLIARIETALQARDFRKSNDLINSLPEPMQKATGAVGKKIADFALVQKFVQGIQQDIQNEALKTSDEKGSNQ